MKVYRLFINGVWYDDFRTFKEVEEFLFELKIDNNPNYHIEVKKVIKKKERARRC